MKAKLKLDFRKGFLVNLIDKTIRDVTYTCVKYKIGSNQTTRKIYFDTDNVMYDPITLYKGDPIYTVDTEQQAEEEILTHGLKWIHHKFLV